MELNLNQRLLQQQKPVLTFEMQQSLKILQMSCEELHGEIERELAENPLLEVAEDGARQDEGADLAADNTDVDAANEADQDGDSWLKSLARDAELWEYSGIDYSKTADGFNWAPPPLTLQAYLQEQLRDLNEPGTLVAIGNYIIENLDERGYLPCSIAELAADLQVAPQQCDEALELIQGLQPWGVAARDLKECLLIQLRQKKLLDPTLVQIVTEYLELIAANQIRKLASQLQLDVEQAQRYCQIIRSLEPKPSRGFYGGAPEGNIVVEAYVIKRNDELTVIMNDNALPKLTINGLYQKILRQPENETHFRYVAAQVNRALGLIKGIEQRKLTLYRVLSQLVELQNDYFYHGESGLKPMTLAEIAGRLKVHESTVSRAIREKYIRTPQKTIKLKALFTPGLVSHTEAESISAQLVKVEIGKLIAAENKIRPLSDRDICQGLNQLGIVISRRTVAKYREALAIEPAARRKTYASS